MLVNVDSITNELKTLEVTEICFYWWMMWMTWPKHVTHDKVLQWIGIIKKHNEKFRSGLVNFTLTGHTGCKKSKLRKAEGHLLENFEQMIGTVWNKGKENL